MTKLVVVKTWQIGLQHLQGYVEMLGYPHDAVSVLQVVLGGLEDPGVGGVGTLDVGATEVGDLHVLAPSPHLTLQVPVTDAGLEVFVEPAPGWPGGLLAPALERPEVVILGDGPGHRLPHHVHQVHRELAQCGPVRLVEMSVEDQGLPPPGQPGEQLGLLLGREDLPEDNSQGGRTVRQSGYTYLQ